MIFYAPFKQSSPTNFHFREFLFNSMEDPREGTKWREWWEGKEPKIHEYLAKLMWWNISEAADCFISPDRTWNPPPSYQISNDDEVETATANVEHDLRIHFKHIYALKTIKDFPILEPYEFEGQCGKFEEFGRDPVRAMAVYVIYCYDWAITGLLTENANLAAAAAEYARVGLEVMREMRPDVDRIETEQAKVRSQLARHAASAKHAETEALKKEAKEFWLKNIDHGLSNDKAAAILAKRIPLSPRTLSAYVREFKTTVC